METRELNRDEPLDANFVESIAILNNYSVPYWVCHGSLLGLVRDKRLIPWDHDVDIAVWRDEVNKEFLKKIFVQSGFKFIRDVSGAMHFERGTARRVDINFYERGIAPGLAGVRWKRAKTNKFARLLIGIIGEKPTGSRWKYINIVIRPFRLILFPVYLVLDRFGMLFEYWGYTTPNSLLTNFRLWSVSGCSVRIPMHPESVLAYLYGNDWNVPKEKFNWTTDSPSSIKF